jgi:ribosomal protein S18 acetylase RimI-like enzyme
VLVTSLVRLRAGLPQVVRAGGRSLRVARWPGDIAAAQLGPVPGEAPPTAELVRATVEDLAELGYDRVLTTALSPHERGPFDDAGFDEHDRLVLLRARLPLPLAPARTAGRVRSVRRRDWPALAELDARAFRAGWSIDEGGIADAVLATPWSRVRATGQPATGYAVTGRSRQRGYLQRLAVDPAHQRQGLGEALALDALLWLTSKGLDEALVNTQESNVGALALYRRLGFVELSDRLLVLGRDAGAHA